MHLFQKLKLTMTYAVLQNLVEKECESWASKGVNVKYATRIGHKGFKAGALKKGMEWDYAKQCEYIALFDADYQPEPDFLLRTVPFLMHNSNVALVQARWVFGKTSSSVSFLKPNTSPVIISVLQFTCHRSQLVPIKFLIKP